MRKNDRIKNILGAIFAIWGFSVFIGTMLIFIIPFWTTRFIKEPKKTLVFMNMCRTWMSIFFPLSGIRVSITGKHNFQPNENFIVVCNHNSLADILLSSPGIPGANKTIAKIELSKIPLFGIIYRRGSVLLNRKSETSRKDSYFQMKDVLSMGMHMCIYPEGTRNKSDQPLKPFHDGAFRLSMETGKKIMPAIITGTREMLPHYKHFYFWPGKLFLQFLDPLDPKSFSSHSELKDQVFKTMWKEISGK
jgi:1-acyl-sn-glycerol-3-phosphate acyltransferase